MEFIKKLINALLRLLQRLAGEEETTSAAVPSVEETVQPAVYGSFKGCYQAKYLLTRNEWYEWKKLQKLASAHGLMVCPKVRLLDIIEPRKGENYRSLLGKIQSKHVDFVICDQDLRIKGVLELDDNSHNRADRQARDTFVDEILTDVEYKVIHTRGITENSLDPITGAKAE